MANDRIPQPDPDDPKRWLYTLASGQVVSLRRPEMPPAEEAQDCYVVDGVTIMVDRDSPLANAIRAVSAMEPQQREKIEAFAMRYGAGTTRSLKDALDRKDRTIAELMKGARPGRKLNRTPVQGSAAEPEYRPKGPQFRAENVLIDVPQPDIDQLLKDAEDEERD